MRFCLVAILTLLMPADFRAALDQKKKETSSNFETKEEGRKSGSEKGKDRVFRVEIGILVEQTDLLYDLNMHTSIGGGPATPEDAMVTSCHMGIERIKQDEEGTIIVGTTRCKMTGRVDATGKIHDGSSIGAELFRMNGGDNETNEDAKTSFRIKVKSADESRVHIVVTTKHNRSHNVRDEATRSWNLRLRTAKTVKLGEEFKLDLADESLLGIKATCEGVIEEIEKD